ncbi:hypothetical protein MRB53_000169 [Persea americana]|uniref:Uncharacterized protein n=1 Tax=Persea americana TaxID=3435 RepID=A0ACC2MNB2_PERAE|nr:hypothetical protein MRB53_000169 [Persea americana]
MDKSWIDLLNRMSREYMDGINHFMEFTNGFDNEFISCPCRKCANRYYYRREFVRVHLILNGFLKQYKNWIRHGEEYVSCRREERDEIEVDDISETDPMIAMLNDIVCGLAPEYTSCETEGAGGSNPHSGADEEALRYFEILDDAQTKLYPGCKDFSKCMDFVFFIRKLQAVLLRKSYKTRSVGGRGVGMDVVYLVIDFIFMCLLVLFMRRYSSLPFIEVALSALPTGHHTCMIGTVDIARKANDDRPLFPNYIFPYDDRPLFPNYFFPYDDRLSMFASDGSWHVPRSLPDDIAGFLSSNLSRVHPPHAPND